MSNYPEDMGKIWVLDTETKGTGANMVPLEKVLERPDARREPERIFVPRKPPRRPREAPPRQGPPRFKVVDLLTRETLAENADGRATVDLLKGIRSVVDVTIWRWDYETESWRQLSLDERRAIWQLRDR
jgi:hypothetical protein